MPSTKPLNPRIGILCREGKTVYYITTWRREHLEADTIQELEAAIEKDELEVKARIYAQAVADKINFYLGDKLATVSEHDESGELAAVICESDPVDFAEFPSLGEGFSSMKLPEPPADLFAEAFASYRLHIWSSR